MKKSAILISFILLLAISLPAQKVVTYKKWKLQSIGAKVQPMFFQNFSNLTYESLLKLVKDPTKLSYDMNGLDGTEAFELEATSVGVFVRFSRPFLQKGWSQNVELGASVYTYAEVYVEYYSGWIMNPDDYLGWCLLNNRIDLEGSYLLTRSLPKGFAVHFGPTITYSTSFNDQVMLFESRESSIPEQVTDARPSDFVYGQIGFSASKVIWDKLEVLAGFRYGGGRQIGESNAVTYNAINLGLAYLLN
ncbi:MAG: hypothetical protein AAF391_10995 [Bacteroidota bacterium]